MEEDRRLTIDVTYCCTDGDGFAVREDFVVEAFFERPLMQSVQEVLPERLHQSLQKGTLHCYEGHKNGQRVDLQCPPLGNSFLMESVHVDRKPVLFLSESQGKEERLAHIPVLDRRLTGSDLIRSMIGQTEGDKEEREVTFSSPSCELQLNRSSLSLDLSPESPAADKMASLLSVEEEEDRAEDASVVNMNGGSGGSMKDSGRSSEVCPLNQSCPTAHCRHSHTSYPAVPPRSALRTFTATYSSQNSVKICSHSSRQRGVTGLITPMNLSNRSRLGSRISLVVFPSNKVTVEVEEEDWSFSLEYHANMTVGEFRADVSKQLNKRWLTKAMVAKPFTLLYSEGGHATELYNHSQFLHYTYFHQRNGAPSTSLKVTVNFAAAVPNCRELVILYRISRLTKVILDKRVFSQGDIPHYTLIAPPDMAEVTLARRTLYDYVTQVSTERDPLYYSMSPDLCTKEVSTLISFLVPTNNCVPIVFHYKDIFSLTKSVAVTRLANLVLQDILSCLKACELLDGEDKEYVLQLTGEYSYICGSHELMEFRDIRNCIVKKEPIHLSVVPQPCLDLYQSCKFERPKIDPYSLHFPLHSDLVLQSNTLSVWNLQDNLRMRLCRVENLKFDQAEFMSVEMSLHFGCKALHKPVSTSHKLHVAFNAMWDEVLEFQFKLCNIPKEAKLLVVLRDSASLNFLWGLYSLYDLESSRLRCGDHTLHLWEVTRNQLKMSRTQKTFLKLPIVEQEEERFRSILAGPPANNPSHTAVRVVLGVETTPTQTIPTCQIIHPSTSADSIEDYFREHSKARNQQLHKHFQSHLKLHFRATSGKRETFCDLHKHLLLVHWDQLVERLEACELLDKLKYSVDKIPIHVALKFLDCDFPDGKVRHLAVCVLERLPDDDLMDYLLQLVQALKFEAHHDSPLARFLLYRALRNKTIGHFFFWYLLCEMQCPQYVPRIATLLEAYLSACGESLLTRYKDELEVQEVLQALGQRLKEAYGKDFVTMQTALPSALRKSDLHKIAFCPISNPRLAVGKLKPKKCKVLSSAKRPIWLELVNVTKTILNPSPVCLIFKMGDDLRQDSITLKMLSLFDKLWKSEGLDLKLIPYGCMATGYKTGFIEVVKNAKTIAEVSGVRENKKLFQWIQSHQMDEYGEVDEEKLSEAVSTFIHSCAGYSVATYTLGIGDRHNDNIMVTTSGNLFHIDFGHFLGHIKHFMGFKREWAPFVLTPDFIYVMGGEKSRNFEIYRNLCCRAFLILRRHADLIINLFSIMRSTGIPELTCVEDTDYIRNALVLEKNDRAAERCFKDIIKKCQDLGWTVQVMWYFHKMRHSSD